ncbi:MAG TPA: hypothetical protein VLB83_05205 [Candidatus Paceibacterota bacterium]|nr:hypothetical protein [Candidatus Paceibacterota bacterium]
MNAIPDLRALGFTSKEIRTLSALRTPQKIQDFVDAIPANFEPDGDTASSVLTTLHRQRAHCFEGALVGALALWMHGEPPLIVDLKASSDDFDHVIAVFRRNGRYGAISKTNHAVIRWRDPAYRTLRELVMSYFHEYYNLKFKKSLRSFSRPLDLSKRRSTDWIASEDDLWSLAEDLDRLPHEPLLTKAIEREIKPLSPTERAIFKEVEWRKP